MAHGPNRRNGFQMLGSWIAEHPVLSIVIVFFLLAVFAWPVFQFLVGGFLGAVIGVLHPLSGELLGIAIAIGALILVWNTVFRRKGKKKDKH